MSKIRITAVGILILGLVIGFFVYRSESNIESKYPFKLGLDLAGGTHLVYEADTSSLESEGDIGEAMSALRDVIEKRVNVLGVSEPLVQSERGGFGAEAEHRLIVELPGITDVEEAVSVIGKTPLLEFKLQKEGAIEVSPEDIEDGTLDLGLEQTFQDTGLTGRLLKRASLQFGQGGQAGMISNEPVVIVEFNSEGTELFAEITSQNIGEVLAIFLDGELISAPVIQQEIPSGTAQITGSFTPEEARELVRDLNLGALPVPIHLISTQTVGATLGHDALDAGIMAGVIGLILVGIFLLAFYRLPGLVAVVALAIYLLVMLALFKLIPVVLTAAGIAGFILSIGMAVDANILIFERMKEELRAGKTLEEAMKEGFSRAWLSIRDGNISSILTAIILFWFGTSLVKGFALTFGLGVLFSMITAISITRTFLIAVTNKESKNQKLFFGVTKL